MTSSPFFRVIVFFTGPLQIDNSLSFRNAMIVTGRGLVFALSLTLSVSFACKNYSTVEEAIPADLAGNIIFDVCLGRLAYHAFFFSLLANLPMNGRTVRLPFQPFLENPNKNPQQKLPMILLILLNVMGLAAAVLASLVFARPLVEKNELPISLIYLATVARWLQLASGLPSCTKSYSEMFGVIKRAPHPGLKAALGGLSALAILITLGMGYSNTEFSNATLSNSTSNIITQACDEIGLLPETALFLMRFLLGGVVYALTFAPIFFKGALFGIVELREACRGLGVGAIVLLGAMLSAFANVADLLAAPNGTSTNKSSNPYDIPLSKTAMGALEFGATVIINHPSMLVLLSVIFWGIDWSLQKMRIACTPKPADQNGQPLKEALMEELPESLPVVTSQIHPQVYPQAWPHNGGLAFLIGSSLLLGMDPGLLIVPLFMFVASQCCSHSHKKLPTPDFSRLQNKFSLPRYFGDKPADKSTPASEQQPTLRV
jgi:hypothetical protein